MLAGRVGAGIASEIGSMVVTQQIDAIRALGTSPIKKIVIPRVLATLVALPLLTVLANTIGVFGALVVGATELGLDPNFFIQKTINTIHMVDYISGVLKTVFFSFCISVPACYFGLNVKEGTRGVGIATTKAVVAGSVMIVIVLSDFFLTKLFYILFEK
jgi:phospholipid/cholesterol/gamma-HCH transport system permease protein